MFNLISLFLHLPEEIFKATTARQYFLYRFLKLCLPACTVFLRIPLSIVLAFFFRFSNDRIPFFQTEPVTDVPDQIRAILNIIELMGAVEGGGIEHDVIMDVGLVDMRRHNKLVPSAGELHSKFVTDPIGLLRRDLSWIESLTHMISDYIFSLFWLTSGDHLILLLREQKVHLGGRGIAFIGTN